jgi:hypothetical protein
VVGHRAHDQHIGAVVEIDSVDATRRADHPREVD